MSAWKENITMPLELGGVPSSVKKKIECFWCKEIVEVPMSYNDIKNREGKRFCSYKCLNEYEHHKWIKVVFKNGKSMKFNLHDEYLKSDSIYRSGLQADIIFGEVKAVYVDGKQVKYKKANEYSLKNFRKEIGKKC